MCSKHVPNNVWRDFRLLMSPLATVAWKNLNSKFKFTTTDFPIGHFMLPFNTVDSLMSLQAFDKFLDHMLVKIEESIMVQNFQSFELFDKKW